MRDELRFDAAIDHRDSDFAAKLGAPARTASMFTSRMSAGPSAGGVAVAQQVRARSVSGLIAQYNGGVRRRTDWSRTMRRYYRKSLTVRGFMNNELPRAPSRIPARGRSAGIAMAASVIARISSTVWRTRRKPLSACWMDATSAS